MKYFQKNTAVKNTTQTFGLMCFRNIIVEKNPSKKNVLKHYKSYRKQQHIQQSMVKQIDKKAKLEINDTEKKNVEKKKEKSIEINNQENRSDTSVVDDDSEINERDVDFKKGKVNLKGKFGKERENSNKIDGKNQLPTINKEFKGDVKECTSCNTVDKRKEIRSEEIKSEIKNVFKWKRKKRKKGEIQTKIEVKQRSEDNDIDNIIDKNEAEKIAKYYGAVEEDEESELEKINFGPEKENKAIGANTKGVNSELDKKSDKLKPIEK